MELTIADQAALIAALRDSRRFPHPAGKVEHIETHCSHLLLAGDYAYKFKKPLDLGFLDYTRLADRAFYCDEELRLNRRLAPGLYLDRAAITGTLAAPLVGGSGPALDYAVRMRRFPDDALLATQLRVGKLSADDMTELAATLATFYREAAVADPAGPYGMPEAVAAPVRDNLSALNARLPGSLVDWSERECQALAPVFARRLAEGRVREGHGDLHLANLLRWHGRIQAFDGIEFDPALRWIDVMNDLAFTLMDLDRRGASALAHRLKSAFLEASGDYGGLRVLRFYQVYRALVRAKVAAIRAAQGGDGEAEVAAHIELAERYIRPGRPRLLITCGVAGSGKSTYAQHVVDTEGAIRLRSDLERKRLYELAPTDRVDAAGARQLYGEEATRRTYDRLLALAEIGLTAGESMIVDATFSRRAERERFRALADRMGVEFEVLALDVPAAELRRRVAERQARGGDPSDADVAVLERQLKTHEAPGPDEAGVRRVGAAGKPPRRRVQ